MYVRIVFPEDARGLIPNDNWFLDDSDRWTITTLLADVCHAARYDVEGHHLEKLGVPLTAIDLATEALSDSDVVTLVVE